MIFLTRWRFWLMKGELIRLMSCQFIFSIHRSFDFYFHGSFVLYWRSKVCGFYLIRSWTNRRNWRQPSTNKIMASIDNNVNHEPKLSYADILIRECGTNNPEDFDNMNNKSRSSETSKTYFLKTNSYLVLYNQSNQSESQMWQYIMPSDSKLMRSISKASNA